MPQCAASVGLLSMRENVTLPIGLSSALTARSRLAPSRSRGSASAERQSRAVSAPACQERSRPESEHVNSPAGGAASAA